MKRTSLWAAICASAICGTTLTACDEDTLNAIMSILTVITDDGEEVAVSVDGKGLGYMEPDEDTSTIEDDIHLSTDDGDGTVSSDLPSKVDLTAYLPPIGNQGNYGTCVAWATAYNCRTWLDAHKNGRKTSQLTSSEIYSPSDIWRGISSSQKNTKCEGTSFQPAFNALVSRGVATWATAPYFSSTSDCDCSTTSTENTDAAKHKIKSYREIKINDVNTVKRYLAEGHPVVLGACLGDNYMNASGSTVIYSKGTTNSTGMHAYHAMMCVGYDNSKGGSNGAFRIVNSWGTSWGDSGFVWLDADYMCSTGFAYTGLVAYLDDDDTTSYGDTDSDVDLQPSVVTDVDLEDDEYPDESADPTWRNLTYDVYNAGQGTVYASSTWGNAYVLYNAYNANEMTVVLVDLYTDALGVAKNNVNYNWDATEAYNTLGLQAQGYSLSNVDIPGETSVATYITQKVDGGTEDSYEFSWTYKMPDVTGSYYLVMIADAFSSVSESSENNNYYFLTSSDGGPLTFQNGVLKTDIANNKALSTAKPKKNASHPQQTAVTETAPNTYSPAEISKVITRMRESGELRNKAAQWVSESAGMVKAKKTIVKK